MARKANFNRDDKLLEAMDLFWRKGYASTAISDLVDELKINRFSLYNTFGDKQQLYYEALEMYLTSISFPSLGDVSQPSASLAELEAFLNHFAQIQRERSCGCFMQNALIEHAGDDDEVLEKGNRLFDHLLEVLTNTIDNGQKSQQITTTIPASALAKLVLNQMQGMRVMGKTKRYDDLEIALQTLLALIKLDPHQ
ncbi:TPA: TetR/AcrR family transcriptional regulator [Vibrio vulnificus]|nr:TetR/AcrR family transcriptional regulator [Vibrio vulnificus]HAS6234235.1 TetR family transcriptional regulator [Vibrio vulnificus]HAS6258997.1 TetR family transcriptional regulator [Vibrio vulnificus]HDY7443895.1 TetR/AcrR family transcriptional regulator [Vibrio vulnificus]HDY7461032.1 TetR/AcrR family transcriptional regulator [Vibrio vulnificus]